MQYLLSIRLPKQKLVPNSTPLFFLIKSQRPFIIQIKNLIFKYFIFKVNTTSKLFHRHFQIPYYSISSHGQWHHWTFQLQQDPHLYAWNFATRSINQTSDCKTHIGSKVNACNATKHETTGFSPYFPMFENPHYL